VKCGHRFEKIESFSASPKKKCPKCGANAERLVSASAIQFKGSGWYVTDYGGKKSGAGTSETSGDGGDSAKASEKSEKSEKTEKSAESKDKAAESKDKGAASTSSSASSDKSDKSSKKKK